MVVIEGLKREDFEDKNKRKRGWRDQRKINTRGFRFLGLQVVHARIDTAV